MTVQMLILDSLETIIKEYKSPKTVKNTEKADIIKSKEK